MKTLLLVCVASLCALGCSSDGSNAAADADAQRKALQTAQGQPKTKQEVKLQKGLADTEVRPAPPGVNTGTP